jgi:hypothetical protein
MQGSKGPFFEVSMQIKYVKMPLSTEEKKAYNEQGFRVIDAQFDPAPDAIQEEKPKRKNRTSKR